MRDFSTKEVFHENRQKTPKKNEAGCFMRRVTQQVFRLFQPAIQLLRRELPSQDSSRLLQAHWWELELSQE